MPERGLSLTFGSGHDDTGKLLDPEKGIERKPVLAMQIPHHESHGLLYRVDVQRMVGGDDDGSSSAHELHDEHITGLEVTHTNGHAPMMHHRRSLMCRCALEHPPMWYNASMTDDDRYKVGINDLSAATNVPGYEVHRRVQELLTQFDNPHRKAPIVNLFPKLTRAAMDHEQAMARSAVLDMDYDGHIHLHFDDLSCGQREIMRGIDYILNMKNRRTRHSRSHTPGRNRTMSSRKRAGSRKGNGHHTTAKDLGWW